MIPRYVEERYKTRVAEQEIFQTEVQSFTHLGPGQAIVY